MQRSLKKKGKEKEKGKEKSQRDLLDLNILRSNTKVASSKTNILLFMVYFHYDHEAFAEWNCNNKLSRREMFHCMLGLQIIG